MDFRGRKYFFSAKSVIYWWQSHRFLLRSSLKTGVKPQKQPLELFCKKKGVLRIFASWKFDPSWKVLEEVSLRCLQHVLKMFLQDVLKTSWKRLEDVLEDAWPRQIYWSWSRRLEDVFWRRMSKVNIIFVFIKTSSEDEDERHLQDAFKTSSSRWMFAGAVLPERLIKKTIGYWNDYCVQWAILV